MADREKHEPSYDKVVDCLYIGDRQTARDMDLLKQLGITHIVNATSELRNYFEKEPGFQYIAVPVQDTDHSNISQYFDETNVFIHDAVKTGHSVLVHCQQGVSRSASVVIAYLMKHSEHSLPEAYTAVKSKRSVVKVRPNFLKQLVEWEQNRQAKDSHTQSAVKRRAGPVGPAMPPSKQAKTTGTNAEADGKPSGEPDDGDVNATEKAEEPKKKTYGMELPPKKNVWSGDATKKNVWRDHATQKDLRRDHATNQKNLVTMRSEFFFLIALHPTTDHLAWLCACVCACSQETPNLQTAPN